MSEDLGIDELRQAIREVLGDRNDGVIAIPGDEGRGLDRALWTEMATLGWLALAVDEEHGGLGLGLDHLGVLYEELGRQTASAPVLPTMLAAAALAAHGDAQAKRRWLPAMAAGDCLAAVALNVGPGSTCRRDGDTVSGEVAQVLFADVADLLLVPVAGGDGDVALAALAADAQGVTIRPRPLVDLTRSMADIGLDAVPADAITWLRPGADGWTALLDHAAMGLACDAVGGADALFERTSEYLMIREQFGRPIGSFQALKHRMADWKVRIDAMRVLARHSASLLASGAADGSAAASGAKAYACDVYAAFAADAVQLHGGIGFTWEHPCHLFLKRARLGQQVYVDGKLHKERVATLAFG